MAPIFVRVEFSNSIFILLLLSSQFPSGPIYLENSCANVSTEARVQIFCLFVFRIAVYFPLSRFAQPVRFFASYPQIE